MTRQGPKITANHAKAMNIGFADGAPIDEFNAELEGALGLTQKIVFVNLECLIEFLDRGDGRFADTDGRDFIRLDEFDAP